MPVSLDHLVEHLTACGLLSKAEVQAALTAVKAEAEAASEGPKADARALARYLVDQGKLTPFQSSAFLKGKHNVLLFGEYIVMDKIGSGGMGVVYKAMHRRMRRVVAVKLLPREATASETAVQRFYREVEAAAKLIHPNIVTAYDASEHRGSHYLVMEYVDGQDLSQVVKERGPLPVDEAVDYIIQAARGLSFAHAHGVIHRDVKPGNMLLANTGTIKLLDMGLARLDGATATGEAGASSSIAASASQLTAAPEATLTVAGRIMGTVEYMSPEHADDPRNADHRADVYSLGCTFFRILTGRLPFTGSSVAEKVAAIHEQPIPKIRDLRKDVPEDLEAINIQMLAKKPQDRFQSMGQVIAALEGLIARGEVDRYQRPAGQTAADKAAQAADADAAGAVEAPIPIAYARSKKRSGSGDEPAEPGSDLAQGLVPPQQDGSTLDVLAEAVADAMNDAEPTTDGSIDERAPARKAAAPAPASDAPPATPMQSRLMRRRSRRKRIKLAVVAVAALLALSAAALLMFMAGGRTAVEFDWPTDDRYGATLLIDGVERPVPEQGPAAYELEPGNHEIYITRARFQPIELTVRLTKGQRDRRKLTWQPAGAAGAATAATTPAKPAPGPTPAPTPAPKPTTKPAPPGPTTTAVTPTTTPSTPTTPVAAPDVHGPSIGPGQWIDLMPLVSVNLDAATGKWALTDTGVEAGEADVMQRLVLPVQLHGDYEWEFAFRRTNHEQVAVTFAVGDQYATLILDLDAASKGGLEQIDGIVARDAAAPAGFSPSPVKDDVTHHARIDVRIIDGEADIATFLDDKPLAAWRGDPARLSTYSHWQMPAPYRLQFGAGFRRNATVRFQVARLRMLSGQASLLRPPPADWAPQPVTSAAAALPDGPAVAQTDPPTPAPKPAPADNGARPVRQVFQEMFAEQLKAARATLTDRSDDRALARKMVAAAAAAEPGEHQVELVTTLCDFAFDLASAEPAGFETAAAAMDLEARSVPDRAGACQQKVIALYQREYTRARADERGRAGELLIAVQMRYAGARAKGGDYAGARSLYTAAQRVARTANSPAAADLDYTLEELAAHERAARQIESLHARLADAATDQARAAIHHELLYLQLLEMDNPPAAAAHVTPSGDEQAGRMVALLTAAPTELTEANMLDLGQWHQQLADGASPDGRVVALRRAARYIDLFLAEHRTDDPSRHSAAAARAQVEQSLAKLARSGSVRGAQATWADLLRLADPARHMYNISNGSCRRDGATIIFERKPAGGNVGLRLPVSAQGSYQVRLSFTRKATTDLTIYLPIGEQVARFTITAGNSASALVGYAVGPPLFGPDQEQELTLTVIHKGTQVIVAADLDGKPYAKWSDTEARLATHTTLIPPPQSFALFVQSRKPPQPDNSLVGLVLSSFELRVLDGRATALP